MEVCPPKVVKCDECETARKDLKVIHHCPSCEQYLCENCDKKMHGKGKRQAHERKAMATHTHFAPGTPPVAAHGGIPDSVTKCDECEGARDTVKVRCDACEQWLCEKCNTKLHKAGKRMAHVRKYFGGGSAPPVQGDKEVAPSSVKACSECETPRAELDVICQCEPCEQWLCEPCDDKLHKKGKRMAHVRKHFNTKDTAAPTNAPDLAPAAAVKCDECEAKRDDLDNIIRCDACEQWLCPNCDEKMHKKGKRIAHERHAYVTKAGAKPLAPKPKADPPAAKSPTRQSAQSNATLTRAVSKAKEREEDKHEDDSKAKAKKETEDKEKAKKEEEKAKKDAEEEKKRKEEERQKAAAEKERKEKERAEADKAKQERDRKLKEAEEKRAREKAALEEKKKKDEEELRLKIEQETREQLEKEEAAKELARKEKAERKKARDDKRRIKAEKQAQKEAEEKAAAEKAEAERLLREKAEGELRAKLEAEARAKIEAEMRAKVEAEMRAKQEEEERQREKKERAEKKAAKEKAEKERKEKEEKERQERIQKEKEELERKAEEERKRIEKEEQEAREQHEREEREAKEREEAEEKEREREAAEAAEAAAAEKARAAAASPKRRPPTIAKGAEKKAAPVAKTIVRSSSGDDELGIGDFDGGPEDEPAPSPSSPSPSTPAATPDLGPEEDVNFLKKGLLATKHDTSFGKKTQKRDMWYEAGVNGGNLQWGRPGEKRVADKKKQLAVVAISEVFVGKSSPSFKKIKEGADPCCFSLVSKERQLDLECANEGDRDSFVRAIQHICKEHMITIQMHGAPKPRTSSTSSNGKGNKKQSVSSNAARSMSPSSAGARAVSPSNAKKPATVISAKNSVVADEPPPARAPPKKKAGDKRTCDDCLDPSAVLAVQCEECEQVLCADCDARIHKKGTRAAHARSPYVEGAAAAGAAADGAAASSATKHVCQDCQDSANEVVCHCAECEQFLCHDCDQRIHKKGTRSKHVRDYLNESNGSASASGDHSGSNSATTSREGALSPAKGAGKSESESKEALGNQAFNNKKYDKAVGYFSELINQNPSGYKYFLKRANCYFFIDKFKDALADANQALDLAPQVMEGYVMKGKSLEKLGKAEEAIAAVQDGLRIEPGNVELKKALAKLKDEASQPPPAEPAPAAAVKGKGHVRQPSKPPPPPNKAPPSSAVSVFNPRSTVADWDGEKEDDSQKKDKADAGNVKAGIKAKLEGGKKGPPPLPSGKAAAGKKEPPPLKKIDKSKTEALERTLSPGKAEKEKPAKKVEKVEKAEEEAPPPAPEDAAAPSAGDGGDEWQELVDPSTGNKYWHNPTTQETTWDDPHAPKEDEWGEAKDPGTGKTYWYNTKTGATTWENPHASEWAESADPATGKTFWYHIVTGQTTWDNPADSGKKKEPVSAAGPAIPTGMAVPKVVTVKNPEWSEHKDPSTGNVYYVNNKTQATTWSNPHQWNEWVDKSTGKKYWNNEVSGITTWEYPK